MLGYRHSILIHGGNQPCHTDGCILPGVSQSAGEGAKIIKGDIDDRIIDECVVDKDKVTDTPICKKIIILDGIQKPTKNLCVSSVPTPNPDIDIDINSTARILSESNESETIDLLLN